MNVNEQIENDIEKFPLEKISKDQQIEAVSGQIDSLERKFWQLRKAQQMIFLKRSLKHL